MPNTDRVVKLLAAKYEFDPAEGAAFLAAAAATKAAPKAADFLEGLAVAEANDAAKKAAKAAKKEAKVAKAAAKAAKEPRPKRAPTGYLLFCADLRPEVKAALEEQLSPGEKLKPSVTVTELAAQWKGLTEEERAEWNAKAAVIKELMVVRTSGDGSE